MAATVITTPYDDEMKKRTEEITRLESIIENDPQPNRQAMYDELKNRGGGPVLDIFSRYFPAPEKQITPEQAKKAKFAAGLTDSFASLAEMFAHGQGARIRNREGKGSIGTTNDRLQSIQDKYDKDMLQWNAVRYDAERQDMKDMLSDANERRGELRQHNYYKIKREEDALGKIRDRQQLEEDRDWKTTKAQEQAQWEFDNIYKPKMELQDAYDRKQTARRARYSGGGGHNPNLYEIPVQSNTPGAQYDPYTGQYYLEQNIPPQRQQTILANLPNGKRAYIEENQLYRKVQRTNEMGKLVDDVVPYSDQEIIRFYLQQRMGGGQQPAVPSKAWVIPGLKKPNSNKSGGTSSGSLY